MLSKTAEIFYKCDNYYNPSHKAGINYMDPELNIDWKINTGEIVISKKDSNLPLFKYAANNLFSERNNEISTFKYYIFSKINFIVFTTYSASLSVILE